MAAQTKLEGRFLGGRPPYGYRLIGLGPHPNPAKAADGKRLHGLAPDDTTAPTVVRIFTEFLAGNGLYVIAEGLTRDGIACPSAYDRARNPHRRGIAWSKGAIRVILTNPRYTGRQVWNKQRTDEILLDVDDVAMGHLSVMRWNPRQQWIVSNEVVHPPIIDLEAFEAAQALLHRRGNRPGGEHKRHRARHVYLFKGALYCALCHRKMQGQQSNGEAYYRCRYAQEYALANKIHHPRNIYLRENDLVGPLDAALAAAFAPHRITDTLTTLTESQDPSDTDQDAIRSRAHLAECNTKLARHRAALEQGADPKIVTGWIAEVEAERRHALAVLNQPKPRPAQRMTHDQINDLVSQLGAIVGVLREADPTDRADVYQQLGLRLTYHPTQQKVRVQAQPGADPYGEMVGVRGGHTNHFPMACDLGRCRVSGIARMPPTATFRVGDAIWAESAGTGVGDESEAVGATRVGQRVDGHLPAWP
jgi:site-specific DNA recombinase